MQPAKPPAFAERLLAWFDVHGRHDLPWQQPRTPYRVWVSEIMLQQTQVSVVADYFRRFMARFESVRTLADAPLDHVLQHWAGLGYYARGRNLHRAAGIVVRDHDAQLPAELTDLQALPGIGRSTAGAIISMGFDRPAAILDGNVKRVLARHAGIAGWPGQSAVARQLWAIAEARLPQSRFADYSQALMDLGAAVCTRRQPACATCPVADDCVARAQSRTADIPAPKPRRQRPERHIRLWLLTDDEDRVLLQRRQPTGVWAGLWSLPEMVGEHAALPAGLALADHATRTLPVVRHELTHARWYLQPIAARVTTPTAIADTDDLAWFAPDALPALPAPIHRLLRQTLATTETSS